MTKPIDPYSRVYWKVLHDDKFEEIRSDMRHFGSWSLMLVVADMAYPAPAYVPPTVPRASLKKLTECGLIEQLRGGLFRVRGMAAERSRRWTPRGPDGTPNGSGKEPNGSPQGTGAEPSRVLARATVESSQDETRQDKTNTAREIGLSDTETGLFALIARHGASIRPDSGFGIRLLGLVERRGIEDVMVEANRLAATGRLSDRQWVFGLERVLEEIPEPERTPPAEEARNVHGQKVQEQMHRRRVEAYRFSGKWDESFGPEPEWQPSWGDKPKVPA